MKNAYEVRGDHAVIFVKCLGKMIETKVSLEGLKKAKEFKNTWYAYWSKRRELYIVVGNSPTVNGSRERYLLSRFVMGKETDLVVDHINLDTLDNRFENLRYVSHSVNGHNRHDKSRSNKTTGIRGIHFDKSKNAFMAYISVNKKRVHIGSYRSLEAARLALNEKRKSYKLQGTI